MSTPTEHTPAEHALSQEALTVALVDQTDDVRAFARDAADARLTEELNAGGNLLSRTVRNIWKGNIAREFYRQRYIREAHEDIVEDESLYANREDVDEAAAARARSATIMKFVGDYEEAIHTEAGEKRKDVTEAEVNGEAGASLVVGSVRQLIREYAEGRLDDDTLIEERNRLLSALRQTASSQQLFGEGVMVADNMLEIAQNVRAAIAHGAGVDAIINQIRVVSGESRSGARTEAQYNKVDKIIDRINRTRVGSLLNEATVATAVSVAASIARMGSTKAVTAAAMTAVPGVGASIVAGIRENKRVKDERRQHAREMATGQEYDRGNARRRDDMQETLYETVSAESLIEDLAVQTDPEQLTGADEARLREGLNAVLEAQSRILMSDSRAIDLIGYSSVAEVETERLVLDLALARAKVNLRNALNDAGDDAQRALGIDPSLEFSDELTRLAEVQQSVIETDISEKDKAFNALKRREVARTAAKAALFGTSIGLVTQEIMAMTSSSRSGLVEQLWNAKNNPVDGRHHDTLLHGIFGDRDGGTVTENHAFSGKTAEHFVGEGNGTPLQLSEELTMKPSGNGGYELFDPTGKSVGAFEVDSHGALTPDSMQKLQALGLTVNDKTTTITETIVTSRQGNVHEFLAQNREGTTNISRDLWYDNNTPSPVFDQNELGLHWGAGGAGVDADGNYVFNVQTMTADGSYHGSQSAMWQQLANEGKLKIALSATGDTQNQVFELTFDANGNVVIPAGSPAAELFSVQNGSAVFEGKYAEVVQSMGVDQSGTEHVRMLATHIGEDTVGNRPFDIPDIEVVTTVKPAYEILGTGYDTTSELSSFVEMAPVIPIYSRKGLENLLVNDEVPTPYYGRQLTPEEIDGRRKRMSPRLQENPDAELDQAQEVDWYLDQQTPEHLDRVKKNVESIKEPMGEDVKTVVTIPVAGHQEADNIYHTLEAYKGQTLENSKFEILLYVNHPITDKEGNRVNADATLAEIERFRRDNPEMPIRLMYEALPREKANIGYIRKVLVDSVLERSRRRSTTSELVIVSNDADAVSIHKKYLERMLASTHESGVDATVGQIDWDNKAYVNHPEVHIGTRFFLMVDSMLRIKEGRTGSNLGANAAFRASMYAAVGGYREGTEIAEDVDLGLDMRAARSGVEGRQVIAYGGVTGSRITTSARRAVYTWLNFADAPYHQWNYPFSADDDEVRSIQITDVEPVDYSDPVKREEVIRNVEHVINKTLESLHPYANGSALSQATSSATSSMSAADQDKLVRHITRALHFMGIEFEWTEPGKIKITDGSKMIRGLRDYANRAVRKDLIDQGVPTTGGMMMVNGKLRKANGQFMSKTEQEAIMRNLPRLFGSTALNNS